MVVVENPIDALEPLSGLLGKRNREPTLLPKAQPLTKLFCTIPPLMRLYDDEWYTLHSNARQPDLHYMHKRHGCWISDLRYAKPATPRVYKTLGYKEGEGSYGSVFDVKDAGNSNYSLVMKISVANTNFFAEVLALQALQEKSPNIPKLYDWFVTDQLPPDTIYWKSVRDSLTSSYQFNEINCARNGKAYGFLIVEKAMAGIFSKFSSICAGRPAADWWHTIDSILFQLLFTAAVLPDSGVLHRDIGGANIMLTKTSVEDIHFQVGRDLFSIHRPMFKPLLIDYGSAHLLETGCSLKTDFRFTTLRYRAPEMIFLSINAGGPLQPYYSGATDLFSIGMSILEMILGDFTLTVNNTQYDNHPFLRYNPPPLLAARLHELFSELQTIEDDFTKDQASRNWASVLRRGFIADDEVQMLARYLWGMCYELGVPTDRCWPGVESTHVWKILDEVIRYRKMNNQGYPREDGNFFKRRDKLRKYLSESQMAMICSMLRYNPKHRPSPAALLKGSNFHKFRAETSFSGSYSNFWQVSDANPFCTEGTHYDGACSPNRSSSPW